MENAAKAIKIPLHLPINKGLTEKKIEHSDECPVKFSKESILIIDVFYF